MIKKFLCALCAIISCTGIQAQSKMGLTVEGSPIKEGEKLILFLTGDHSEYSAYVKNGIATFNLTGKEPCECSLVRVDEDKQPNMLIYLDYCDTKVRVLDGTYENFHNAFMNAEVTGNATHKSVEAVNDLVFKDTCRSSSPMESEAFLSALKDACTKPNMASAYILCKYCNVASHFGFIKEVKACYDKMPENVKNSYPGKSLAKQLAIYVPQALGNQLKDFTMTTPEDKQVSMLEYVKGKKIVLIDFWASWCAPCRQEGKNVKAIYEDMHDKGFDVLGVSLDTKREAWLKGIEEEGYKWTQVSDLKGFQSPTIKDYDIKGIPALFLVDGDGKVIAKGLRGDDMRKKVEEYCK